MEVQEISLYDLFQLVRARRRVLYFTMILTTTLALLIGLFATPLFQAEAVLVPVSTDLDDHGSGGLSGSLGGLASLAGLGGTKGESTEQNVAILESRALAEQFVTEKNLAPALFPDKWDSKEKHWKKSLLSRTLSSVTGLFTQILNNGTSTKPNDGAPSPDQIYRAFDKVRSISKDKETGLVTLGMELRDPALAAAWANEYVKTANDYIRTQQINESTRRLEFLSDQLKKTNLTEIQDALYKLVASETKRSMIANVREEFAFKVIDPATAPEIRASPKRALMVLIGLMAGFMLGLGIILIQNYINVMRNARQE